MSKRTFKFIAIALILIAGGFLITILSIGTLRSQITEIVGFAVAQPPIRWNNVKDAAVGDDLTNGIVVSAPYLYDGTNFDAVRGTIANGMLVDVSRIAGIPAAAALADATANPTTLSLGSYLMAYNTATWDRVLSSLHGDGLVAATYPRGLNTASFGYLFNGATYDRFRGDTTNGLYVNVRATEKSGTAFYSIKRTDIAAASQNLAFGFTSKKVIIETPLTNTDEVVVDWIGGAAVVPAANTAGDDRIAPGRTVTLDNYAVTSISVIAASGTQTIYVRAWN